MIFATVLILFLEKTEKEKQIFLKQYILQLPENHSEQENIFISEYEMPDEFIEFANIEKTVLSSAIGNNSKAIEKIFTNKKTYDKLSNEMKERQIINTSKQMNLFDFGIY